MLDTLLKHAGWMPISTLLTFPKLKHWTNAAILVGAFSSTGGHRYELSFDERLWNPPNHSNEMARKRTSVGRSSDPSWKKFVGNDENGMEWNGYKNDFLQNDSYTYNFDGSDDEQGDSSESEDTDDNDDENDSYSYHFDDNDDENGDLSGSEDTDDYDDETEEYSSSYDDLEHRNFYPRSAMKSQSPTSSIVDESTLKASNPTENEETSKVTNIFLSEKYSSYNESQSSSSPQPHLGTQIEKTKIVVEEKQRLDPESSNVIPDDDDWSDLSWSDEDDYDDASKSQSAIDGSKSDIDRVSNGAVDFHYDNGDFPDDQSKKLVSIPDDKFEDDFKDFPRIWKGDHIPYDLSNAFVRKKSITLATIKAIEEESMTRLPDEEEEFIENYDDIAEMENGNLYPWEVEEEDDALQLAQEEQFQEIIEQETKQKKISNLKKYSTDRDVIILKHPDQISVFCNALIQSTNDFADRHTNSSKARAIGFDVEYCSLDYDIRLLPAMIQLASPEEDGLIGLLWIDKFPNHGRDMLSTKECAPLISLLSDSSIAKVGVGVSKDAKRLAEWWGVNDANFVDHFIANVVDLENDCDDRLSQKSLKEMARLTLNRNLPKLKEIGKEAERRKQKMGKKRFTAHWRRPNLTENMVNYAAGDAACSIDVWLHIHGMNSQFQDT
jgi:hypothetical protein